MGGRALVAAFGAAAQAFMLAGFVAGVAHAAEVPAEAEPAGVAATLPAAPAVDDALSEFPAPASTEDEPPVSPAAAPDGDIARAPADATDSPATPPSDGDQKPAETAATAPSDVEQKPEDAVGSTEATAPAVAEEPKPAHPVVVAIRDVRLLVRQ